MSRVARPQAPADSPAEPASATGSAPDVFDFARSVALGLSDTPRWVPVRFLYDAHGSALFDQITMLPEYYPTRTEAAILERHAAAIRDRTGPLTLIELGAGSAIKTDVLLSAYAAAAAERVTYVPVDVSATALRAARNRIVEKHAGVRVKPVVGLYEDAFPLLERCSPSMLIFLGSTIGNFAHAESYAFWGDLERHVPAGDFFLLGVDLVKDETVLEAAYNDAAGVTAQFTLNLFHRMNRELGAGLDVDHIRHVARYNKEWQRIEVFAEFTTDQTVAIEPLGRAIEIQAGEKVLVEISRKFVIEPLRQFVACFGFGVQAVFTDERDWFAVLLLQRRKA